MCREPAAASRERGVAPRADRQAACQGVRRIVGSCGTLRDDAAFKNKTRNSLPHNDEGRLDGWEEIASFLGRGIRTVYRWEKEAALPVRRLFKERRSLVHAYRQELARWVKRREDDPFLPSYFPSESPPDGNPKFRAPRDVLAGWKEVAAFLGRSVRTVQRWENEAGLPVRRLRAKSRSIPYALRSELAVWLKEWGIPAGSTEGGGVSAQTQSLLQTFIDGYGANIAVLDHRDGCCRQQGMEGIWRVAWRSRHQLRLRQKLFGTRAIYCLGGSHGCFRSHGGYHRHAQRRTPRMPGQIPRRLPREEALVLIPCHAL